MICREFKVLPNDSGLANLSQIQIDWIVANMISDSVRIKTAMGGDGSDTGMNQSREWNDLMQ